MSAFDYRVTPLPAVWPGKATPSYARKRPQFKTIWGRALDLLAREVSMLGGKNVEIAIDVEDRHLRLDGQLRADARPRTSGVVVSFDVGKERLAFPCDTFTFWQENVDAIARALEALRMVDRYGVQTGKQYTGFKQLPPGREDSARRIPDDNPLSAVQAASNIAAFLPGPASFNVKAILADRTSARSAVRVALSKTHPDAGGASALFADVQLAKRALEAHHGGPLV